MFSAPIAAVRVAGRTVVAGLVAAEGIVRVVAFGSAGETLWSTDALQGVAWIPDAELRLLPMREGLALMWRGLRDDGGSGRTLALLGANGEPRGRPLAIGGAPCATMDTTAWIEPRAAAPAAVRTWRPSWESPREAASLPLERTGSLVCGDSEIILLAEGDEDVTATFLGATFLGGTAEPVVVARDADFPRDEEREHEAFSIGNQLGLLRVGGSGAMAVREVAPGAPASPWRQLKHSLAEDDDIVAVDGEADSVIIVYAREPEDSCASPTSADGAGVDLRAVRVDRATEAEARFELAPPSCDRSLGPFWIAASPGGASVGWVERGTASSPVEAPIRGAAIRMLRPGNTPAAFRIEQAADALVNAGCDEDGCAVAALVREAGADGMRPAAIRALSYR
jgi:hypothetical protein